MAQGAVRAAAPAEAMTGTPLAMVSPVGYSAVRQVLKPAARSDRAL